MTNCTGKPEEPGKAGNWKAATRAPAILFQPACKSCCTCWALRVRAFHGVISMPPKPELTVGTPVIWNIWLYSGMPLATW